MHSLLLLLFVLIVSDAQAVEYKDTNSSCHNVWKITFTDNNLTCNSDNSASISDATGSGGGDPILIDGTAVTDASGVDLIGGTTGIDITFSAAASPDTATLGLDLTEITCGAGLACSAATTIATASSEADFLTSGALTCGASTQGKIQVHTTPLQYCDNAATPALRYAAYGASDGDALAGDSATSFFDTGTIEHERGGLEADVSAYSSLLTITGGATGAYAGTTCTNQLVRALDGMGAATCATVGTADVAGLDISDDTNLTVSGTLATLTGDTISVKEGTLTDEKVCTYEATGTLLDCNETETGTGSIVRGTSATIATPIVTGKVDRNDVAVDDDDCTGEQGIYWYDTTDSAFEFCNANSGVPTVLGGGGGSGDITDVFNCSTGDCASIATTDGDLLDFSSVTVNTTSEGIILPVFNSSGTAEGQISWEGTNDILYVGDGTVTQQINGFVLMSSMLTSESANFWTQPGGGGTGTEANADQWRMPQAATCGQMYAEVRTAPGVGNSWTVSLNIAGTASTNLTCTISNSNTACSDLTGSESITANTTVNMEWLETGTATATNGSAWSLLCVLN